MIYNASDFQKDVDCLVTQIKESKIAFTGIYGIPKGGVPLAIALSNKLDIPLVNCLNGLQPLVLVVDDLIDTGRTLYEYVNGGFHTAVLHRKPHSPIYDKNFCAELISNEWVDYFWEDNSGNANAQEIPTRLLEYIGEDPTREGLVETPKRFIKAWDKLTEGYSQKVEDIIKVFDGNGYNQIVLLKDIELYSMCEHHLLPFWGKAHVAYIPGKKVLGISKLARLIELYSRRLQIQERLGDQVVKALMDHVQPKGAACIIEAAHLCMRMRGVQKQNSVMVTSSLDGVFMKDIKAREELMRLIR